MLQSTSELVLSKKVVLGTYAFAFPKQELEKRKARNDPSTHEWTCLLRSADPSEDISSYIRKVTFHLHPSFINPQRTVEQSPFQVCEVGWGEFEILARIHLIDPEEKVIDIKHYLKLYPDNTTDLSTFQPPDQYRESCVASEYYDEILFRRPSERMQAALLSVLEQPPHPLTPHFLPSTAEQEEEYVKMAQSVQKILFDKQQQLKKEIEAQVIQIQSLMDMYYLLHPEKALQLLAQDPSLLKSLAKAGVDSAARDSAVASLRQALKNVHQSSGSFNVSKERMQEIIDIFEQLVETGVIDSSTFV